MHLGTKEDLEEYFEKMMHEPSRVQSRVQKEGISIHGWCFGYDNNSPTCINGLTTVVTLGDSLLAPMSIFLI